MSTDNIKEKILKLRALANDPNNMPGERDAAKNAANSLMEKYNISEEDLTPPLSWETVDMWGNEIWINGKKVSIDLEQLEMVRNLIKQMQNGFPFPDQASFIKKFEEETEKITVKDVFKFAKFAWKTWKSFKKKEDK